MIGLDTNVLVRYLTLDDPEQAERAERVIDDAVRTGEPLFVSAIVVCELVWVLERGYRFTRGEVEVVLDALLRTAQLHFRDKDLLWAALADYRASPGDFADYVLGRDGAAEGCTATVTFDRALSKSPLFEVLPAAE